MQYEAQSTTEVLVVGAGPTGLALALVLTRLGVRVRIIDRNTGVAPYSRALGVHARTLEFYRQLGFVDEVVAAGVIASTANLWSQRRRVARVEFDNMGAGLTRYPFILDYAQDQHERLLTAKLELAGVQVERQVTLVRSQEEGEEVRAVVRNTNGVEAEIRASYIAGCDGMHSAVRESLGVQFSGGTYERLFYVADVVASGPPINDGVHVDLDEADLLAIFDMKGEGHARLVGTIPPERLIDGGKNLTFADIAQRPLQQLALRVERVNWFSTYRVHHRVADRFNVGRAFLLGDAAHVHSPVGAQGMNTGIGDAVNLAWKLADVLRGRAKATLLDTYETERIVFARRLVSTTDRAFELGTRNGPIARFVRKKVFPVFVTIVFGRKASRRFMFRTVSQIEIKYRDSAISAGKAGKVHGGDRLPWVRPDDDGENDNFVPLKSWRWQVHVYGEASAELRDACREMEVELHQFDWKAAVERAGLARNAVYLIRPDGYVALADAQGDVGRLQAFVRNLRG